MSTSNQCHDCGKRFNFFSPAQTCNNEECQKKICKTCLESHPLVIPTTSPHEKISSSNAGNEKQDSMKIQCFCKQCFGEKSVLDFTKTFDIVEPEKKNNKGDNAIGAVQPSGIVVIFGHGGGGSRAMFRPHAEALAQRYGHKCILFDFPGHGTCVQEPLDLKSCSDALHRVLQENKILPKDQGGGGGKNIYIGGSFGAYVGFHILEQYKEYFSGAVLLDCGQNVGPGASLKARVGLWFLRQMGSLMSNKGLMEAMMGVTKKSHADYYLVESSYGAGMFFDQAAEQVRCLQEVEPAILIPKIPFPILFMNGTEDYRDSEEKWLSLCVDKDHSELKDYEHGDHFFTHDSRFVEDMLSRWDAFSRRAVLE